MPVLRGKGGYGVRNALWWMLFLFPAVILQRFVPGVDFLSAGFLVTLQERRYADLIWAIPLLIFLQEGMGTQAFGVVLLRYAAIAALFSLGRWLFDVESFLYAFLFCACLSVCCSVVVFLMSFLYDVPLSTSRLLDESVLQALFLPPVWKAARMTRSRIYADEAEYPRK
jgi:cell shape-determining protein MreD